MGQPEEIRRFLLNGTNSRRSSFCSSRIVEIPVENFVYQTQIDTLQWQLKQVCIFKMYDNLECNGLQFIIANCL